MVIFYNRHDVGVSVYLLIINLTAEFTIATKEGAVDLI